MIINVQVKWNLTTVKHQTMLASGFSQCCCVCVSVCVWGGGEGRGGGEGGRGWPAGASHALQLGSRSFQAPFPKLMLMGLMTSK